MARCLTPISILNPLWISDTSRSSKLAKYILVPCGKCVTCLLRKRAEWAYRGQMERLASKSSYFVTLTYDEEHLDKNEVSKADLVLRIKRIRKYITDKYKLGSVRYFAIGEYGSKTYRAHYHILFFFSEVVPQNVLEFVLC